MRGTMPVEMMKIMKQKMMVNDDTSYSDDDHNDTHSQQRQQMMIYMLVQRLMMMVRRKTTYRYEMKNGNATGQRMQFGDKYCNYMIEDICYL